MIDEARHLAQEPKYFNQSSWGSAYIYSFLFFAQLKLFSFFFFFSSFSSGAAAFKRNGADQRIYEKRGGKVEKEKDEIRKNDKEKRKEQTQATGTLD